MAPLVQFTPSRPKPTNIPRHQRILRLRGMGVRMHAMNVARHGKLPPQRHEELPPPRIAEERVNEAGTNH